MSSSLLPSNYYLSNFQCWLSLAWKRYTSFFQTAEQVQIQRFGELSEQSQALFVRLFNRKGDYFCIEKLEYPELGDLHSLLQELGAKGFIQTELESVHRPHLLPLLSLLELKALCHALGIAQTAPKAILIERLQQNLFADQLIFDDYSWIYFSTKTLFFRLMVLFFGNRSQSLKEFVLVDLGKACYESYEIDESSPSFPHRDALEQYLKEGEEKDRFWQICQQGDFSAMKEKVNLLFPVVEQRKTLSGSKALYHMIFWGITAYEKQKEWELALSLYQRLLKIEPDFEVLQRILQCLEKLKRYEEAYGIAREALLKTSISEERLFFQFHLEKNAKRLKRKAEVFFSLQKPPQQNWFRKKTKNSQGQKALYQGKSALVSVETLALEAYQEEGWSGFLAENAFILSAASFLCWDILFAPLPQAFLHPFQRGPRDLFKKSFYASRELLFQNRWDALEKMTVSERVDFFQHCFSQKSTFHCILTSPVFTVESFYPLLAYSATSSLLPLFQEIFRDLSGRSRGFPDLFLWKNGHLRFVEVKGVGDHLSDSQRVWLDLLARCGYSVELCTIQAL